MSDLLNDWMPWIALAIMTGAWAKADLKADRLADDIRDLKEENAILEMQLDNHLRSISRKMARLCPDE